jgi:hypothetical protein
MRRVVVLVVLIALLLSVLYFPIKIPYDLVSVGVVSPLEEWKLVQDANGGLLANRLHYRTGITSDVAVWQFNSGDISGMDVAIPTDSAVWVSQGDTIIRMYSAQVQEQILDLENSLKYQRAQLQNLNTGEKPPTVQQAESELKYAQEQLDLAEKQYTLKLPLFQEGLLSKLEFQTTENAVSLAKTAVKTAEKQLDVVATGEKPEIVQVTQTEINNLQRRLDFLRQRNASYMVVAPFNGISSPVIPASGDLLVLQNIDIYLVHIPIKTRDLKLIGHEAKIFVTDPSSGHMYPAQLLEKGTKSEVIGSNLVNFLQVSVQIPKGQTLNIGPGAHCLVHCDDLSPIEYLKRIMNTPISSE